MGRGSCAAAQSPHIRLEQVGLVGVERQRIFPDVPILEIAVELDLLEVRRDSESTFVGTARSTEQIDRARVASCVRAVVEGKMEEIELSVADLPSGIYLARIRFADGSTKSLKITKI